MKYIELLEIHHDYGDIDYNTKFQPIKSGDTVKVFHGYRDLSDAVSAARYGLSGKMKADRNYSFEFDNNPYGLFVTLNLVSAEKFASGSVHDQVIMEFVANVDELEPPVWPGGGYTVQGQMAQYFGHGGSGKVARKQAQADRENDDYQPEHVLQSDKKYLSSLMTSGEYQALYVGHLSPDRITGFMVRPGGKNFHYKAPWERLTREEFIERYGRVKPKREDYSSERIYGPNDDFNGDEFLKRMAEKNDTTVDQVDSYLRNFWRYVSGGQNRSGTFADQMKSYIWPKQVRPAIFWMKDRYKN